MAINDHRSSLVQLPARLYETSPDKQLYVQWCNSPLTIPPPRRWPCIGKGVRTLSECKDHTTFSRWLSCTAGCQTTVSLLPPAGAQLPIVSAAFPPMASALFSSAWQQGAQVPAHKAASPATRRKREGEARLGHTTHMVDVGRRAGALSFSGYT